MGTRNRGSVLERASPLALFRVRRDRKRQGTGALQDLAGSRRFMERAALSSISKKAVMSRSRRIAPSSAGWNPKCHPSPAWFKQSISPSFIFFRVLSLNYAYFQFMHFNLELKLYLF